MVSSPSPMGAPLQFSCVLADVALVASTVEAAAKVLRVVSDLDSEDRSNNLACCCDDWCVPFFSSNKTRMTPMVNTAKTGTFFDGRSRRFAIAIDCRVLALSPSFFYCSAVCSLRVCANIQPTATLGENGFKMLLEATLRVRTVCATIAANIT